MTTEQPPPAPSPEPGLPIPPMPEAEQPEYVELATPGGAADGVVRCQQCGASEVNFRSDTAEFQCAYCRFTWKEQSLDEAMKLSEGIGELRGTTVSSAAVDIIDDAALVTMKCTGCGSEVVIDTDHNLRARCHWCKHELSLNNRIPNGAVPDGILPFSVTKAQAMANISAFVNERKTFAHPGFSSTFTPENVMGVYMPYMTVDGNVDVRLDGEGEVLRRTVRVNDKQTEYHADRYTVMRELSMEIDDLIVETSSDRADIHSTVSTNNIINAVLPFDVKNMVRFNSNFLGAEYTSERRDMDVDAAEAYAASHFMTLARAGAQPSVRGYDRGVEWTSEQVNVKGSRWTAVLLPVWLYGFVETRGSRQITHYIAVNGRTGATMGSVPINRKKAALVAWGTAAAISVVTWPIALAVLVMG
ncbi:TFIIB-type zinc ribbon-containing protein [Demequina sp. TTPB684]|uniref:TFIIB-type zinc ribbon-containing protein n=1 Tax=unclassified Demequina TaxID=2620311 RepID=UPI001CF434A6|nr:MULTISPECIES: TFIIB-type zinc ribbon-containing protein [unclassified Demequina]MCB2412781.1 TFIIB-type zinc ribbon-containing protein [Demequina sp. TTPB684]UPU87128.1 TFIIB-type zinc ribbon-containing protein [Demequina sp. TMPB413]